MADFIEECRAGRRIRPAASGALVAGLLAALTFLGLLPYLRAFDLPLISDDYLQVLLGRKYGPISGWPALAQDALYRCRATSILLTWWTESLFGVSPVAFAATSVALHVLNTWLVFAMGAWSRIGWRVSFVAAAFFAVYQGHQEAVIWYSALPELLMFFFGFLTMLCWLGFLRAEAAGQRGAWFTASLLLWVLSLLSKESAVIFGPVLVLIAWVETRSLRRLIPLSLFALIGAIYVGGIFAAQKDHLHFNDGTFSLSAPFWIVWRNSFGRLLWVWGAVSLVAIGFWREWRKWWPAVSTGLVWISLTLLPFCFLTYMPRIPSRHTYLASAGLGLLIAAFFFAVLQRTAGRRWIPAAVAALIVTHQAGYVLFVKHRQYVERAEPTEALLRFAKQVSGPIYIHCFPYGLYAAQTVLEVGIGKDAPALVFDPDPATATPALFCLGDRKHSPRQKSAMLRAAAETRD
jgi:hypothetical protein